MYKLMTPIGENWQQVGVMFEDEFGSSYKFKIELNALPLGAVAPLKIYVFGIEKGANAKWKDRAPEITEEDDIPF